MKKFEKFRQSYLSKQRNIDSLQFATIDYTIPSNGTNFNQLFNSIKSKSKANQSNHFIDSYLTSIDSQHIHVHCQDKSMANKIKYIRNKEALRSGPHSCTEC